MMDDELREGLEGGLEDENRLKRPTRVGRARERQRRRKGEQAVPITAAHVPRAAARPTPRKSSAGQLAPLGGLELPSLNSIPFLRPVLVVVGAVLFMGAVIFAVSLFKNDPPPVPANALWVGEEWTYETRTDDDMDQFVAHLRRHEIGTVYARISDLNFDGSWTGRPDMQNQFEEVRPEVTRFAQQFKAAYPDVQLYGVIGVQADLAASGYRLDEDRVQRVITDFSTQIVGSLGYDGVMLNIDPVWDGDDNFLAILRRVRGAIGDEKLLAIATPPDWTPLNADVPTPSLIAPGTVWDATYKQRIALIQPDQIVIRAYNSYLDNANDYTEWMAYQVQAYIEAIAPLEIGTNLIFGIPTYDDLPPAHDVAVENVASALNGIRRGLNAAGEAGAVVQGVAIYANWTTEPVEWEQFKAQWVDR